jgi:hypothetical protein
MQQAAINRIQERQLAAQERTAAATEAMQKTLEKGRDPSTGRLPVQMGGMAAVAADQQWILNN